MRRALAILSLFLLAVPASAQAPYRVALPLLVQDPAAPLPWREPQTNWVPLEVTDYQEVRLGGNVLFYVTIRNQTERTMGTVAVSSRQLDVDGSLVKEDSERFDLPTAPGETRTLQLSFGAPVPGPGSMEAWGLPAIP